MLNLVNIFFRKTVGTVFVKINKLKIIVYMYNMVFDIQGAYLTRILIWQFFVWFEKIIPLEN